MTAGPILRLDRPRPPEYLVDAAIVAEVGSFRPAPDIRDWIRESFLEKGAPFHNADHAHLLMADVGILWTNVDNVRQMRSVVGMAEMPNTRGSAWQKARSELQLRQWFGSIPDFVITLSAPYCANVGMAAFGALIDHELFHCAQAIDSFGSPRFSRSTGRPIFAIRDHDVTEFVGVVRRWGISAAGPSAEEFVRVAQQPPEFSGAHIAAVCGTCLAKAA